MSLWVLKDHLNYKDQQIDFATTGDFMVVIINYHIIDFLEKKDHQLKVIKDLRKDHLGQRFQIVLHHFELES